MFLFWILFAISFIFSGVSLNSANVTHVLSLTTIALGFFYLLKGKVNLQTPPNFIWIVIFLVSLQVSLFLSQSKILPFYFLLTFTEAVGFWFLSFNLKGHISKYVRRSILGILFLYSSFYLVSNCTHLNFSQYMGYFYTLNSNTAHHHLGDIWFIGIILGGVQNIPLLFTGLFFLTISHSRSAFLALLVCLFYFLYKKGRLSKKFIYIAIAVAPLLFIYTGFYKTIIFSRPYYIQSLIGFLDYPLGVGMGNFSKISNEIGSVYPALYAPSTYTLNIVLEALSGLGLLSIPFVIWLILSIKNVLGNKNYLWSGIFLATTVNFLFDYAYIIPGMVWFWFISLGLSQRQDDSRLS